MQLHTLLGGVYLTCQSTPNVFYSGRIEEEIPMLSLRVWMESFCFLRQTRQSGKFLATRQVFGN